MGYENTHITRLSLKLVTIKSLNDCLTEYYYFVFFFHTYNLILTALVNAREHLHTNNICLYQLNYNSLYNTIIIPTTYVYIILPVCKIHIIILYCNLEIK